MIQVAAFTVFALLLARVVRAPRGTWRFILGGAVLVILGTQLLPAAHPFRLDLGGAVRDFGWTALVLAPVGAYVLFLRAIRSRTGVSALRQEARHPAGLVRIGQDAALAADTRAALAMDARAATGRAPEALSLGWRGEDGVLLGHARLRFGGAIADLELLWVAPGARRQGIGARLVEAAEAVARERGAAALGARVEAWQAPEFFAAQGFRDVAERGPAVAIRRYMEKPLA